MSKVKITYKTTVKVDIDLNKVKEYLKSRGWTDDGPYGLFGRAYRNGDGYIILMTTDKIGDWNPRMSEFVHELAEFEKRPIPEVLEDLTKE